MELLKPKNQMKIHLYLSLFFLPLALIYAVTGVGYIFGFNQNSGADIREVVIDPADHAATNQERSAAIAALAQKYGLQLPANTAPYVMKGNVVIGGLAHQIVYTTDKDGAHKLQSVRRGIFGTAVMLHKSQGEALVGELSAFDLLGIGFGVTLFLLYFSGLIIIGLRKLKGNAVALGCIGGGVVATAVAVVLTI